MARVVLERSYDPATGEATFSSDTGKLMPCMQARSVKHIRSLHTPDFSRTICEFEAADADTVRDALRQAGVRFDRVWKANVIS